MARPKTKEELLVASKANYQKLLATIDEIDPKVQEENFVRDETFLAKKKEHHWRRDQNLRDILIHLYEWQQMQQKWMTANLNGKEQPFLPAPYNWRNYGQLNEEFVEKHQQTSLKTAKTLLENSHNQLMDQAASFSNEELFTKGNYSWVGTSTLGAYFVSNLPSHYDWANKKIKQLKKQGRS